MNKLSKGLLLAGAGAALAALLPYKVTRDQATGAKKIKALTWDLDVGTDDEGRVIAQFHMPPANPDQEDLDWNLDIADDGEETVQFYTAPAAPAEQTEAPVQEEEPAVDGEEQETYE